MAGPHICFYLGGQNLRAMRGRRRVVVSLFGGEARRGN
jgi:hypothetical protein